MKYLLAPALMMLISWYLSKYLTEDRKPLFPFKPFNCRPCLTFWLTLCLCLIPPTTPFWLAICAAFANYYLIARRYKILD